MHLLEPKNTQAHPEFIRRRRAVGLSLERLSPLANLPVSRLRAIESGINRPATVREVRRVDHVLSVLEAAYTRLRLELVEEMRRAGDDPNDPNEDGLGGDAA